MMDYLRGQGIPVTGNNRVKVLTTGQEKFIDLFDAIRQARHHVHLEYFNFRNDSIANALFDLLAKKVREGVEVRALFDAFGRIKEDLIKMTFYSSTAPSLILPVEGDRYLYLVLPVRLIG